MQSFPGIPVMGQGNPLPAESGYEGEWLHQPHLFLYRPLAGQSQASDTRMTAGFNRSNGDWTAGFDAGVLARQFHLTIDELFEHNRNGTLVLVTAEDAPPQQGGLAAKIYVFRIGHQHSILTIEKLAQEGTA